MARINSLDMTMMDVMVTMSDGNPGALTTLMEMLQHGPTIDPDAADRILAVLHLDTLGIYGSRIYMLWNDVCRRDIAKTLMLLRANQLGMLSDTDINHAIDNYGDGIDMKMVSEMVKGRLPNFKIAIPETHASDVLTPF